MSSRVTGEITIKVPTAVLCCDGPCGRSWTWIPGQIVWQDACQFRGSPEQYLVTGRVVVGLAVNERPPQEVIPGRHLCDPCVAELTTPKQGGTRVDEPSSDLLGLKSTLEGDNGLLGCP